MTLRPNTSAPNTSHSSSCASNTVGCDVSQAWLDIFDPHKGHERVPNKAEAIAAWAAKLCPQTSLVVLEATGSHDRLLRHALADACIPFARVNPVQARRFAQACGSLAKTDRIDASLLSRMGKALDLAPASPPDAERERLQALARRRDQLVEARAAELRHKGETDDADVEADIALALSQLDARINALEAVIAVHIQNTADLADQARRLQTAPGIGAVTATTLLALMPELGHLSPKQAASLAGLAPHPSDSGTKRGRRPIKGGRPRVRRALYMAALSAIRACARFNTFYKTLANRSGSKKLAIIAVARKLLTALNAMMRDKTAFQ